jgi:hypothetical protein
VLCDCAVGIFTANRNTAYPAMKQVKAGKVTLAPSQQMSLAMVVKGCLDGSEEATC